MTQGSTVTTTDYIDGIQYTNNVLDFVPTAEGYVKNTVVNGNNTYSYVFNYEDIWGNTRISYAKSPANVLTILDENNYYPFGMRHSGYNNDGYAFNSVSNALALVFNGAQTYQYKYQGQERQDELNLGWDSFKWRNYDYAIGRFMSVDPLSEKYAYNSVYAFQENKMGMGRELEGLEIGPFSWVWSKVKEAYHESKLARDIPRAVENSGLGQLVRYFTPKTEKLDKPDKASGIGLNLVTPGGKPGIVSPPEGPRDAKQLNVEVAVVATDVWGPKTTTPGAAPDGSNPLDRQTGNTVTPGVIPEVPTSAEGEIVTVKTKDFSISPVIKKDNVLMAEAQVFVTEKDTNVVNGQQNNVKAADSKKEQKYRKLADEINSNN